MFGPHNTFCVLAGGGHSWLPQPSESLLDTTRAQLWLRSVWHAKTCRFNNLQVLESSGIPGTEFLWLTRHNCTDLSVRQRWLFTLTRWWFSFFTITSKINFHFYFFAWLLSHDRGIMYLASITPGSEQILSK